MPNLYICSSKNPDEKKVADSLDREYIASYTKAGKVHLIVVNDEQLEDGSTLITVTPRAWYEMEDLV